MKVRRVVVAVIGALATLVVWLPGAEAATGTYVALGDSYTAGPLVPTQIGSPYGCLRSDKNYPHVAAPQLSVATLRDVSCSGARTDHMTAPQNVDPDGPNPPQLNAVDSTAKVVTLGIGGNDIGFSDIVQSCVTWHPFGSPCKNKWAPGGVDQITARINATAPKVAAVIQGIRARAPQAKIFVVGYPAILPDSGSGCWPQMPIAWNDVSYLRAKTKELNTMLSQRAAANGARYVDVYTPSRSFSACASSSTRWVEPIVPDTWAAPVHPNARGMAGMAGVVVTAIRASGAA
jgi:lysophospholipase L1-like esterase